MWRDLLWFDAGYTAALVIGNPLYGFLAVFVAYALAYVPLVAAAATATPANVALLCALAGSAAGLVALKTYGPQFPATTNARAFSVFVPLQITALDVLFPETSALGALGALGALFVSLAYIGFNLAVFSWLAPKQEEKAREGALDLVRFIVLGALHLLWSAWSRIAPALFATAFYRMYVLNILTLAVLVFDSARRQRLQREAAQHEAQRVQHEEEARRAFEAENREATQYVAQLVERDRSGKGRKMKKRLEHAQREYEARVSAAKPQKSGSDP